MTTADSLLHAFDEMLAELEPYLLSPELFWPLGTSSSRIRRDRLTLGNLLLCLDQLAALRDSWDVSMEAAFRKRELRWEHEREKWQTAIGNKAARERRSRLNLWRAYLTDLDDGQAAGFDYQHEVRNRVIIERLLPLDQVDEAWKTDLQHADRLLKSLVVPSAFVWAAHLAQIYPPQPFWFLYRTPRTLD